MAERFVQTTHTDRHLPVVGVWRTPRWRMDGWRDVYVIETSQKQQQLIVAIVCGATRYLTRDCLLEKKACHPLRL